MARDLAANVGGHWRVCITRNRFGYFCRAIPLCDDGTWPYRGLPGIKPDESQPGFKRVIIDPRPAGDLTWAKARYDTIRGPVVSEWKLKAARLDPIQAVRYE